MIRFSRFTLWICGIIVILLLFYLQRLIVFNNSNFTYGVLTCDPKIVEEEYEAPMSLFYYIDMKAYQMDVTETTNLANQQVVVRYPKNKPEKGKLYTRGRFWGIATLWMLLPAIFWTAFVFTLLNEDMKLEIDWRKQ